MSRELWVIVYDHGTTDGLSWLPLGSHTGEFGHSVERLVVAIDGCPPPDGEE